MRLLSYTVYVIGFLCLFMASVTGAARADIIEQIRVEGVERIDPATVLSYMDVQAGDRFSQAAMDTALKNLFATGLFADVSLYRDDDALVVAVIENPIINQIAFEGNKKLKDDELSTEIQLRPRVVFTRTRVQEDVARLQEIYRANGRYSASIEPKVIMLDQNRVNLVFEINEGPLTKIRRINFIGNTHYSDNRLRSVIVSKESKWYTFLTANDNYDPDRLDFDGELLRRYYLDHGYADFKLESVVGELAPDRSGFFVTFTMEEGPRYRVSSVDIESNIPELDPALLYEHVPIEAGDWYDASLIEDTVVELTDATGNMQFAFVDIRPKVERDRANNTIAVTFVLNESQRVFVEQINIHGNVRTLDRVIRREIELVEGDPFNRAKIKKSEQNIKDLNYFEESEVKISQGSAPDKTVVDVEVQEKSTGELSIGAGFSTQDGPLANFRITERNLLGKGQYLSLAATISGLRNEFDLSFTEPYFLKRDLRAGFDVFHITRDLQDESSYDQKQSGFNLRLGYPVARNWRQNLRYRLLRNEITDVQPGVSLFIRSQEGDRLTSAISQTLTYDTRDSKLDPTEGMIAWLDTEVAGVGGDARYVSGRAGFTYYYPVYDEWILSFLGEGGYIVGFGGENVQINERFFIGGSSLRGFSRSGIGPRDRVTLDALGGNRFARGSVELGFPSGLPEQVGVRLHAFSDFGVLGDIDGNAPGIADEETLRLSVGGGISWQSPFGPIRVDAAVPVLKEDFDEEELFRFNFGTSF